MPYGHLIAATVMTLGVCQGHSSIASFSMLTCTSHSSSAIAELLVLLALILIISVQYVCCSGAVSSSSLYRQSSQTTADSVDDLDMWTDMVTGGSPASTSRRS